MIESVPVGRLANTDLNMYQCGTQDCSPGHSYGPITRDHYLIHYILSGRGIFQVGGTTYHLKKGQGFLICPGIITYYEAHAQDPWNYSWVGFHGLKAESYLKRAGLTLDNPIFSYHNDDFIADCFAQMMETQKLAKGRDVRLLSLLYLFLSRLIEVNGEDWISDSTTDKKDVYVKKVIEYIEMNYSRKISVSETAHYIGLDRCYLGSVFKSCLNISIQEFLINFRVSKACELMNNNSLSIGDISRSVGYDDPLLFSKVFKKVKGLSPREYKKTLSSN